MSEPVDTAALRRYANAGYILSPRDTFPLLDELDALRQLVKDYEGNIADKRRLTRELDVAMNGEDGAATQASLCDLVDDAKALRERAAKAEAERDAFRGCLATTAGKLMAAEAERDAAENRAEKAEIACDHWQREFKHHNAAHGNEWRMRQERDAALAREAALREALRPFAEQRESPLAKRLREEFGDAQFTFKAPWSLFQAAKDVYAASVIAGQRAALRDPTTAVVQAVEDEIARRGIEPPVGLAAAALRVAVDAVEREGSKDDRTA